jgi:hypothetical protein
LFTLFVTPAVYSYIARDRQTLRRDAGDVSAEAEAAAAELARDEEPVAEGPAVPRGDVSVRGEPVEAPLAWNKEDALSSEARAFSSAAEAAGEEDDLREKRAKRPPKRRRYPSAAE